MSGKYYEEIYCVVRSLSEGQRGAGGWVSLVLVDGKKMRTEQHQQQVPSTLLSADHLNIVIFSLSNPSFGFSSGNPDVN